MHLVLHSKAYDKEVKRVEERVKQEKDQQQLDKVKKKAAVSDDKELEKGGIEQPAAKKRTARRKGGKKNDAADEGEDIDALFIGYGIGIFANVCILLCKTFCF